MTKAALIALIALALESPFPIRDLPPQQLTCEEGADAILLVEDLESGPSMRVRARVVESLKGEHSGSIDLPVRWPQLREPHYAGRPGVRKLVFVFDGRVENSTNPHGRGCGPLAEDERRPDKRRYPDRYHLLRADKTDFERLVIFVRSYLAAIEDPTPTRLAALIESTELAEWRAGMQVLARVDLEDRSAGWARIGEAKTRRMIYDLEHVPLDVHDRRVIQSFGRTLRILQERHQRHGEPLPEWRGDAARVLLSYSVRTGNHVFACVNLPRLGYGLECDDIVMEEAPRPEARPHTVPRIPDRQIEEMDAEHGLIFHEGIRPDELPERRSSGRRPSTLGR